MKKIYATLLLLSASITQSNGAQVVNIKTGNITEHLCAEIPQRTVEKLNNGIRVSYSFSEMLLDSIPNNIGEYTIAFPDFGAITTTGFPTLPAKTDAIEIPYGSSPTISVESCVYEDYSMKLALNQELDIESTSSNKVSHSINKSNYELSNYVQTAASIRNIQTHKDRQICYVNIFPVKYNPSNYTVQVATNITYVISYEPNQNKTKAKSLSQKQSNIQNPILANVLVNTDSENAEEYVFPDYLIEVPSDYLIISTPKFKSSINRFSEWKKALGFHMHECYKDKWNSDSEIKDSIDKYYELYPNLSYLLIVGNNNEVPGMQTYSYDKSIGLHLTDLYYGSVDENYGFKTIPDLSRGRIPANNNEEALIAFDKIIAYEVCTESEFSPLFTRSLHCAFFQDRDIRYSNPGYEDTRFIQTSEEILSSEREIGVFPERIYKHDPKATQKPQYYNVHPTYQGNGQPLPEELTATNFNWSGTAEDINNSINKGHLYVLYRGHGNHNAWGSLGYTTSTFQKSPIRESSQHQKKLTLDEYVNPPIFSITCLSGKYDQDNCIATAFLTEKKKGGSCVIAASDNSYSGFNDAFVLGMFDAFSLDPVKTQYLISRNKSLVYRPVLRLGHIMDQGLYRMYEKCIGFDFTKNDPEELNHHQYEIFHCFGDPTMLMRTTSPTQFHPLITMDSKTLECTVSTREGPAFISFYDKVSGKNKCIYADTAKFTFSQISYKTNPDDLLGNENIIIYGPNKIPYIKTSIALLYHPEIQITNSIEHTSENNIVAFHGLHSNDIAFITLTNAQSGDIVMNQQCNPLDSSTTINMNTVSSGIYVASLIINGKIEASQTIKK